MKAVVLFPIVVLVGALPTVASAQVAPGCAQVVQNINNLASTIAGGASSYWSHRKNFVELKFGPSSLAVPNAAQLAEQEKIQADPLKAAMQAHWQDLRLSSQRRVRRTACLLPSCQHSWKGSSSSLRVSISISSLKIISRGAHKRRRGCRRIRCSNACARLGRSSGKNQFSARQRP
jgi:hypothetical protein